MSSQSKRRAESEEVSHKKKPRKGGGGGEEEEFKQGEDEGLDAEDDDVGALDKDNTIPVEIRTRGKRVDYTKVGLDDDNGFEARKEVSEKKKGVPAGPGDRSSQRVLAEGAEGDEEEGDDDEEEGEYGEGDSEDDDGTDDYEEDEEE